MRRLRIPIAPAALSRTSFVSCLSRSITSSPDARVEQVLLPFMEPLHIVGSGSIGLLVASSIRMAFPSYPLTMLVRPHHESRLQRSGGTRRTKLYMDVSIQDATSGREQSNRKRKLAPPRLVRLPAQILRARTDMAIQPLNIQNLLVTTKAPDAVDALRTVLSSSSSLSSFTGRIIVLCNGALAVRDEIERTLLSDETTTPACTPNHDIQLTLASTTHGAYRDIDTPARNTGEHDPDCLYHVVHAGVGKTYVENQPELSKLFDQSGLQCRSMSSPDMELLMWHKLAANCVINPLTAILRCTNGELLQHDLFHGYLQRVVKEISNVAMRKLSFEGNGDDRAKSAREQLTAEYLDDFVNQVIRDTASNKSSMLQDILHGRPTEIDYLNGYIVQKGKEVEIDVTANQELWERASTLDKLRR